MITSQWVSKSSNQLISQQHLWVPGSQWFKKITPVFLIKIKPDWNLLLMTTYVQFYKLGKYPKAQLKPEVVSQADSEKLCPADIITFQKKQKNKIEFLRPLCSKWQQGEESESAACSFPHVIVQNSLLLTLSLSSSTPSEPHGRLVQPKYRGTADNRKHTPRLHLQNPLIDTHTKRRQLLNYLKRYALQVELMQKVSKWQTSCLDTSTAQFLTYTCRTLYQGMVTTSRTQFSALTKCL